MAVGKNGTGIPTMESDDVETSASSKIQFSKRYEPRSKKVGVPKAVAARSSLFRRDPSFKFFDTKLTCGRHLAGFVSADQVQN